MSDQPVNPDDAMFKSRGFSQRYGFGARPALIVIDMQKGFTDESQPLASNLDNEIAAIQPLLDVAHARDIPVFFTACAYDHPQMKDAGIWHHKVKGLETLRSGSRNTEIDDRLEVRATDALMIKKYASCFFGTDLGSRLTAQGIDTLVITGCTTSGCVRATAVDSCQSGLRPIVVREAVGDRSKAAHDQSLFDLEAKYADVVTLDETLAYLKLVGHNAAG